MNWRVGIIIFWFLYLSGCRTSNSSCEISTFTPVLIGNGLEQSDSLSTNFIFSIIKKYPFNFNLTYSLSTDPKGVYLNYVSKSGFLIQINLIDSSDLKIYPFRFLTSKITDLQFQNDSAILLDHESKRLFILTKSAIGEFRISKEIDFSDMFQDRSMFIHFSLNACQFKFISPFLYFVVGDLNRRNFLGKHSLVSFNIFTREFKFRNPLPECFSNVDVYSEDIHFQFLSKNNCLVSYSSLDQIQCFDTFNNKLFDLLPGHPEPLREFDKSKVLNAAYVRKFEIMRDKNLGLIAIDSSNFLLFRRVSTKDVNQVAKYYCNYYRDKGRLWYELEVPPVIVRNIIVFKNKVFILSPSMKYIMLYKYF